MKRPTLVNKQKRVLPCARAKPSQASCDENARKQAEERFEDILKVPLILGLGAICVCVILRGTWRVGCL